MWINSVNRKWAVGGWSPGKVKILLIEIVGRCLLGAVDVCLVLLLLFYLLKKGQQYELLLHQDSLIAVRVVP